jgi:hypothetical protein
MYYKSIKSPELEAVIVEQILVVCVNRTRFNVRHNANRIGIIVYYEQREKDNTIRF